MIEQIITGLIGGLVYSLTGLAKSNSLEKFNWSKMVPTLIVGGVIGVVAALTNQDYGIVANLSFAAGLTAVVENIGKAVYRKAL